MAATCDRCESHLTATHHCAGCELMALREAASEVLNATVFPGDSLWRDLREMVDQTDLAQDKDRAYWRGVFA